MTFDPKLRRPLMKLGSVVLLTKFGRNRMKPLETEACPANSRWKKERRKKERTRYYWPHRPLKPKSFMNDHRCPFLWIFSKISSADPTDRWQHLVFPVWPCFTFFYTVLCQLTFVTLLIHDLWPSNPQIDTTHRHWSYETMHHVSRYSEHLASDLLLFHN